MFQEVEALGAVVILETEIFGMIHTPRAEGGAKSGTQEIALMQEIVDRFLHLERDHDHRTGSLVIQIPSSGGEIHEMAPSLQLRPFRLVEEEALEEEVEAIGIWVEDEDITLTSETTIKEVFHGIDLGNPRENSHLIKVEGMKILAMNGKEIGKNA